MLQAIREKAQGWIAWAIVILITIPFALWGIQEYLGAGSETTVAQVDGQQITEQALVDQTRQTRDKLRANLGASYRADLFSEDMLRAQTLDRMINERLLEKTIADWGMRASDQMVVNAIRDERSFQKAGKFSHELYRTVLSNNAMTEASFEASVRHSLTLQQLQAGVAYSAFATNSQVAQLQRLRDQKRTLSYAVIPVAGPLATIKPDDKAVEDYYQAHARQYQLPERVKLDYLLLDVDTLAKQVKADKATVKAWYADHKDEFVAPEERRVRHILIATAGDAAAALAKAQALRAKLVAGTDFAELAKTESADPVSAAQGGDLGWISRGMMVKPFEKAAFALAKGKLSEPVKSKFGYHLIQVEDIRGGGPGHFDQLVDKVTAAYRKAEADRVFYDRSERLAELAYENPDNLEQAAETLGLTVQHSGWLDRNGGAGVLASPKVTAAAFSDDVLQQGNNSELLELAPEKVLVLRVVDHQASRIQDLDEVHDKVVQAVRLAQASEAVRKTGEDALASLKSGTSLQAMAKQKGWQYHASAEIGREEKQVPAAVRERTFALPHPAPDATQVGGVALAGGDYALLALTAVTNGKAAELDDAQRKMMADRLAAVAGRTDMDSLVKALRAKADVEISLKPGDDQAQ
jgi:peptidyl-prolyl cis-trans isomerase D